MSKRQCMMDQTQKPQWTTEFKIDDSTWDALIRDSGTQNSPPLGLACERGFVDEARYLQAEQSQCNLPLLNREFFSKSPDMELLKKFDLKLFKQQGLLPVGQWDGHTYFAKLSASPLEIESTLENALFVLAPWTGMKRWFAEWEKSADVPEATTEKPMETPTGLTEHSSVTLNKIDFGEIKLPEITRPALSVPNIKVPDLGTPAPSSELSPDFKITLGPKPAVTATAAAAPVAKPAPPPVPAPVATAKPTPAPSTIPITLNMPPIPSMAPSKMHVQQPPPPSEKAPTTPVPASKTAAPLGVNVIKGLVEVSPIPLEQIMGRVKLADNFDNLCMVMLGAWKNYFHQSMILTIKNDRLMAHKFSGPWQMASKDETAVSLDNASIFKIVADTNHAYHGYVVPSVINQEFFDKTSGGKFPEHVSLVPIILEGAVFAMIYGCCSKEDAKKTSVASLEAMTNSFSEQLSKLMGGLKKAS